MSMKTIKNRIRDISLTSHKKIKLSKDIEIAIVHPSESIMFRNAKNVEKLLKILSDDNWIEVPENVDLADSIEETILTFCIRHPDDIKKQLVVKDDSDIIADYQVRFSDFNPEVDKDYLVQQGIIKDINRLTPIKFLLTINIITGRLFASTEEILSLEENAETFPEIGEDTEETPVDGVLQGSSEAE